ncbi:MAG: flagellar filament capping protein FliD [Pseudomonadales bacterium]
MQTFSSLGVGSGLDLNSLVTQLVQAERAPAEGRLDREQVRAQTQLSAFGSLRSAASRLESVLEGLAGFRTAMRAVSSDPDRVLATAGADAEPGRYQIQVTRLASAQSLATEPFADADAALGDGVLRIATADASYEFEIGTDVTSLRTLRDAINAGQAPVQAILVNDAGGQRLLLTARNTGTEAAVTITVDGTVDTRLASSAMVETAPAVDAAFRINGLALTSAGNELSDLIPGVTVNLRGLTEGDNRVDLVVEPDNSALATELAKLVEAHNALVDVIASTGRADPGGNSSGPLVGNSALRSLQSRIAGVFSAPVAAEVDLGSLESMLDLGLRTGADGKVSLDTGRLDAALASNADGVGALVASFSEALAGVLGGYTSADGLLTSRTDTLNDRLRRVARQREALDARMVQVEARLRKQFAALDTLVSRFQQTSGFLEDQLASLAALRPGNGT